MVEHRSPKPTTRVRFLPLLPRLADWAIERLTRRVSITPVVTLDYKPLFDRYAIFRPDEWPEEWYDRLKAERPNAKRPYALPWYFPFNAFLHHWTQKSKTPESFHDHPRWSITICLKGRIIERTPWRERTLTPGSVVVRSRRYIHAFQIPEQDGDVWTLFIVGRRKHRQNGYVITPG